MMGTIGDTISPEVLQDDITFIAKIFLIINIKLSVYLPKSKNTS